MKLIYVTLIFISLASAELETLNIINDENSDSFNINDLVDGSISRISQFIIKQNLDPLNLPQTETKLWTTYSNATVSNEIEPMIYKAKLILHSGILKRLSNLKRYGNAILNSTDKLIKLDVGFEFIFLQGTYSYTVNLVFFNLKGGVRISTANVRSKIIVSFDTMNYILSLDKFELQVPSSIKVIVENKNGQVDWINTAIVNIVIPFFKNTIINTVEKEAANAIQTYFDNINRILATGKPVPGLLPDFLKITNIESTLRKSNVNFLI